MNAELSRWLTLQNLMRELQQAPGWEAFVAALRDRRGEALDDVHKTLDPRMAGFVDGLDWVLAYPQTLIDQVTLYRESV